MATIDERIAALDAAIDTIIAGGAVREYEINGRSVNRYSLNELITLKKEYLKEKAAAQGGMRNYVDFQTPDSGTNSNKGC